MQVNEKPYWKDKHYACFKNTKCEFFPCHEGIDPKKFNCLFCYCPLYFLGEKCGGHYKYLSNGVKDCSSCLIPHITDNYGYILRKLNEALK